MIQKYVFPGPSRCLLQRCAASVAHPAASLIPPSHYGVYQERVSSAMCDMMLASSDIDTRKPYGRACRGPVGESEFLDRQTAYFTSGWLGFRLYMRRGITTALYENHKPPSEGLLCLCGTGDVADDDQKVWSDRAITSRRLSQCRVLLIPG